jgi:hypothetical protein
MGNNTSNIINDDNLMTVDEKDMTKYLYNFISEKDVDKMNATEKYFYTVNIYINKSIKDNKNKIILGRIPCIYYFLTKLPKFKSEILSIENIDENKWNNTCARFEFQRNEKVKFQEFLNSTSNYEKFMCEISIIIRDKIYDKFRKSKNVIFVTDEEDEKIIPLVGLHSTTYDSYNNILKTGFNPPEDKIYGKVEGEEWPVAMFTNPFLNFYEIYATPQHAGRQWQTQIITLTNGIIRMLRTYNFKFPIIIAIFQDIKGSGSKLTAEPDSYIQSFDKRNIKIIGVIHVEFEFQVLKKMEKEFEKTGRFNCGDHPKLPLNYTVEWFM